MSIFNKNMIALFGEMSEFFINLDRLRLRKTWSDLFFEIFGCVQTCKIVGKLLQLWTSIFNVPLDCFLNLFGVIVVTSSTPKVWQATLSECL